MRTLLVLGVALLPACGAGTQDGGATEQRAAPSRNENVITEEEIRAIRGSNVLDVVRTLRPRWLRTAPTMLRPEAEGGVVVYVDRTRMGGLATLRQVRPDEVWSLRYYSPSEAASEFGPGHLHGAIQISTRR